MQAPSCNSAQKGAANQNQNNAMLPTGAKRQAFRYG